MKILIDPGHRNNNLDYGACGNGQKESILALQISKKLKVELGKHNIICYMTRESENDTISVSARPQKAAILKCDLLISVHINSAENTSASGIEVLYKSQQELAESVCNNMCKATGAINRGGKLRTDLGVLNGFKNSILVECGFISNIAECTRLINSLYQDKIVNAIVDAIIARYKIVVVQQDDDLIKVVTKLVHAGVKINEAAWNDISKINLTYAQALIEKIGALFGATNYFGSIDALVLKKAIEQRGPWDRKEFKVEHIRSLIIKSASKI